MSEHLRKPDWLKIRLGGNEQFTRTKSIVESHCLHTICTSGKCPNMGECWSRGTATFMIAGDICTRSCRFCNTLTGKPLPLDPKEPANVAESIRLMNLKHAVITSVDRDDLPDLGAQHWVDTIRTIKAVNPETTVEVLIPDFQGRLELVDKVVAAAPEIISHNMETVRRISPEVRSAAKYEVSLSVLARIAAQGVVAKTGIMVGLGETVEEVCELMDDVRAAGVSVLTIGQYLQPSRKNIPVKEYVTPEQFESYKSIALQKGFKKVESAPLVRSSYHAENTYDGENISLYSLLCYKGKKGGKGMNKVKRSLDNQAIGLVPLLLFMFLDNYFSYLLSFIIGVTFCFVCIFLFQILSKDKVYQFLLLPAATTLVLYSIFLCLRLEPVLFIYSPLITEVLLVVVLVFLGFAKRTILRRIRTSQHPTYKRTLMRTTLNEFFFVAQLIQNLYTLHLFIILVYSILPETMQSVRMERFLYRELGIVIGVFLILYEQIRISMMQGSLRKEMWLPVLNDGGKVIGCIARSVSRSLPKKYYHPVVRVAVIYQGMLYLVNRGKKSFVSPDTIDYPFYSYVLFRHSIESTVRETMGGLGEKEDVMPRFLIRYTFENEKVKHLVNLYVMCVRSEKVMDQIKQPNGKLWTSKQIEENLGSGVFSEYFEQEFAYLQNTVLLAENFCCAGC